MGRSEASGRGGSWGGRGEGEDGVEVGGVGEDHEEAVEAEGDAAGGRHVGEVGEEGFVERIFGGPAGGAGGVGGIKTAALFGGVVKFAVGVGEFDAAEVEFPAVGAEGVVGEAPGKGGECLLLTKSTEANYPKYLVNCSSPSTLVIEGKTEKSKHSIIIFGRIKTIMMVKNHSMFLRMYI